MIEKSSDLSRSSGSFWRKEINSLALPDIGEENGQNCSSTSTTVSGQKEDTIGMWPLALFGLGGLMLGYLIGRSYD